MGKIIKKRELKPSARRVITLSHHVSYKLAKWFPKSIPIIFVTGYPKSGTVWACQMVADYLQLPFADLSFFPIGFPSVMHGHQLIEKNGPPAVYVMRDGRDTMVSMYFHIARELPEGSNPQRSRRHRNMFPGITDLSDVKANLPRFMEGQFKRPNGTPYNWGKHVQSYYEAKRTDVPLVRFEDLKSDAEKTLTNAIEKLTDEPADSVRIKETVVKYSFSRQSGRKAGEEDRKSFLRKGAIGDWVNYFSPEAAQLFDEYYGSTLIETGYANDRNWINMSTTNEVCNP